MKSNNRKLGTHNQALDVGYRRSELGWDIIYLPPTYNPNPNLILNVQPQTIPTISPELEVQSTSTSYNTLTLSSHMSAIPFFHKPHIHHKLHPLIIWEKRILRWQTTPDEVVDAEEGTWRLEEQHFGVICLCMLEEVEVITEMTS